MFTILKLIIWAAGVLTLSYFVLPYFDYEVNLGYFQERKAACQEKLAQCQKDLIKSGLEGAREKCDFRCVDTKLLIRKSENK